MSISYNAPVLGKRSSQDHFCFYGEMVEINERKYAVDGVGVVSDKLVVGNDDLFGVDKEFDFLDIKGTISIYTEEIRDNVSFFKINPDPIGSCLVYYYDKNGVVAFSSDLNHLVSWLRVQGIKVEKSIYYQAMILAIGDGAFGHTSYDDICVLESSKYVIAYQGRYKVMDYGVEEYFGNEESYESLLSSAKKDIQRTLLAIRESKLDKIAHLTGGMDSRLVVSAISATGYLDDYSIFCSGQHGYPDFDTAYALCSVLGARMTNKQSLIQKKMPRDFEEYYKWSSADNLGMLPNQATNIGMVGNNGTLVLSGGYGECLRGYNLHCKNKDLNYVIENLWPFYDASKNIRVPVGESVVNGIKSDLGSYFISKLEKGWSINDALQLLYIQEKNRYFVGNISHSYSRYTPRIDPLYSLPAFKAAYKMEFNDRANRELMYDLMSSFNKRLANIRFGTTSWPDELVSKKSFVVEDFPKNLNVSFENIKSSLSIDWLTKVSPESKKEAVKLGAPAWQVHNYRHVQELAKSILSRKPEFFEFFDRVRVMRLLNNKHENRQNIRKVFQIYYSVVWLYK